MTVQAMRIGGRWYVPIDTAAAREGDVVEYVEPGIRQRRTHRVVDARGGKEPAVRVELHQHESRKCLWVPIRDVVRCWRKRTEVSP